MEQTTRKWRRPPRPRVVERSMMKYNISSAPLRLAMMMMMMTVAVNDSVWMSVLQSLVRKWPTERISLNVFLDLEWMNVLPRGSWCHLLLSEFLSLSRTSPESRRKCWKRSCEGALPCASCMRTNVTTSRSSKREETVPILKRRGALSQRVRIWIGKATPPNGSRRVRASILILK